jgi:hypothetical protein
MGSWGPNSFENDAAMDWASEARAEGLGAVAAAIEAVLEAPVEFDADTAVRGIAAVETLVTALGQPGDGVEGCPEIEADPKRARKLTGDAELSLIRVTSQGCELRALWDEAGPDEFDAWIASLTDLRSRLGGAADGAKPKKKTREKAAKRAPAPEPEVSLAALVEDLAQQVRGLRFDIEVIRQEFAEGLASVRRDIRGHRS